MVDNPNPEVKWRNMRRMAWISLLAGLVYPVAVYVTDSTVMASIGSVFYVFVGSVVGAYMGFSTWGDKK